KRFCGPPAVPGAVFFKGPCPGPESRSLSRLHSAGGHSQRWRLTPALPILFCGSQQGGGENAFRRTKVTTISRAWCPRFASVFWTLTWVEEVSGRTTGYFQLTTFRPNPSGCRV